MAHELQSDKAHSSSLQRRQVSWMMQENRSVKVVERTVQQSLNLGSWRPGLWACFLARTLSADHQSPHLLRGGEGGVTRSVHAAMVRLAKVKSTHSLWSTLMLNGNMWMVAKKKLLSSGTQNTFPSGPAYPLWYDAKLQLKFTIPNWANHIPPHAPASPSDVSTSMNGTTTQSRNLSIVS